MSDDARTLSPTSSPAGKTHNRNLLMVSISKFYTVKGSIQRILPIITGTSRISLRLIDWFVTNYSKRHNVAVVHNTGGHSVHFNVYASYRAQLKAYSKQQFDPFRRRDRIDFYYDRHQFVETTIGQLNFFRWMLQNGLVEYIDENFDAIETEMLKSQKPSLSSNSSSNSDLHCMSPSVSRGPESPQKPALSVACDKPKDRKVFPATPPRTVLFD